VEASIDSFFTKGVGHRVCEDYVVHNDQRIILCDGCSSAPYSDTGARILAHSILHTKTKSWYDAINRADDIVVSLGLPRDCISATIVAAQLKEGGVTVNLLGDGAIISRERQGGELKVFNLNFKSGAPYYLRYALDADIRNDYIQKFGDIYDVGDGVEKSFFTDYPDGVVTKEFSSEAYDLVAIFSDGINRFQITEDGRRREVPLADVIQEFMSFKNYAGNFVQRRCTRAFEKSWAVFDDFSMGAIKWIS
jgi:hypothetical protein